MDVQSTLFYTFMLNFLPVLAALGFEPWTLDQLSIGLPTVLPGMTYPIQLILPCCILQNVTIASRSGDNVIRIFSLLLINSSNKLECLYLAGLASLFWCFWVRSERNTSFFAPIVSYAEKIYKIDTSGRFYKHVTRITYSCSKTRCTICAKHADFQIAH